MRTKKALRIRILKDSEDIYYENREKFINDKHFAASVLGFAFGCEMILKFPFSNNLNIKNNFQSCIRMEE